MNTPQTTNSEAQPPVLPELFGSPKQIAWATDLRKQALAMVDSVAAVAPSVKKPGFDAGVLRDTVYRVLVGQRQAGEWIDVRDPITAPYLPHYAPLELACRWDAVATARAAGILPDVEGLPPHTLVSGSVLLRPDTNLAAVATVSANLCSCGWGDRLIGPSRYQAHLKALPREELKAVIEAHPEGEHGCPASQMDSRGQCRSRGRFTA